MITCEILIKALDPLQQKKKTDIQKTTDVYPLCFAIWDRSWTDSVMGSILNS